MRRFIDCNYIEEHNFTSDDIEITCNDFIEYSDFKEALSDILTAIDSCDTYCISEDFEMCGNFDGYLRLYNLNRDRIYYLYGKDIEDFMKEGCIRLSSNEPSEDDINDFERMY